MANNPPIQSFQDLIVWQKAMDLIVKIYDVSRKGPLSKDFELKNQVQSASVSIASNIAEGHGRFSRKDYARFISIANGSTNEVITQLILCRRLTYIDEKVAEGLIAQCDEIIRMLKTLRSRLL
jgi:four helix bundle protein